MGLSPRRIRIEMDDMRWMGGKQTLDLRLMTCDFAEGRKNALDERGAAKVSILLEAS